MPVHLKKSHPPARRNGKNGLAPAAKHAAAPKKVTAGKNSPKNKPKDAHSIAPNGSNSGPVIHPTGQDTPAALPPFEVFGQNAAALFTLKAYRGEGMCLLAMDWAKGQPPQNFVGFAIEYQEPGGTQFYPVKNRLSFLDNQGNVNPNILSSRLSPIQKFRWVHFPLHPGLPGNYVYRVTPVFMDSKSQLSYGDFQEAAIQLMSETYPGALNVAFTRGFIASQAFVDQFGANGGATTLLPASASDGLKFVSTNPKEQQALDWMGFEARQAILSALDGAIAEASSQVRVAAYDLNEPEIVSRLEKLGARLRIIIDDSGDHGKPGSAENQAADLLVTSAGASNVQRQHMGQLQHNKTISIKGTKINLAVCGSTNLSWRGLFIQNNNAIILSGGKPVQIFFDAFDNLWANKNNATGFGKTNSASWNDLQLPQVNAKVTFSPHGNDNAKLAGVASDIGLTSSSLLYSLAFLYESPGPVLDALKTVTANNNIFVYGISDKTVGGLDLQKPDGNPPVAFPEALLTNVPEPFKQESTGGKGVRMHHKFLVIDFDKADARVYMGSYNFSHTADTANGENLLLIQDRRVAVSYMIEAVAMFDHYEYRDIQAKAGASGQKLYLHIPPQRPGDKAWWEEDYGNPQKIRDRQLFSK